MNFILKSSKIARLNHWVKSPSNYHELTLNFFYVKVKNNPNNRHQFKLYHCHKLFLIPSHMLLIFILHPSLISITLNPPPPLQSAPPLTANKILWITELFFCLIFIFYVCRWINELGRFNDPQCVRGRSK